MERERRTVLLIAATLAAVLTGGCGTQQMLLGTDANYLVTAMDAVTTPGREVSLRSRIQAGDLLSERPGVVLLFYRDGQLFKAARTDGEGQAAVRFTPSQPGDYVFTVQASAAGLSAQPPAPRELLVACHPPDQPIAVVDLDKTVVASGFEAVLIGEAQPMAGSADVLREIAKTYGIVYLTHRPEYFGPKSKAWLIDHGYPRAPVLLSTVSEFIQGSGAYKTQVLNRLSRTFSKVALGIGDKFSDVRAYHSRGMRAFLVFGVEDSATAEQLEETIDELESLPEGVQVVWNWQELQQAYEGKAQFPPSRVRGQLQERMDRLQEQSSAAPPPAAKEDAR